MTLRAAAGSRTGRLYIGSVILAGAVLLGVRIPVMHVEQPLLFLTITAAAIVISVSKVNLPVAGGSATLSGAYFTDLLALMLLGPDQAMVVAAASAAAQCRAKSRTHHLVPNRLQRLRPGRGDAGDRRCVIRPWRLPSDRSTQRSRHRDGRSRVRVVPRQQFPRRRRGRQDARRVHVRDVAPRIRLDGACVPGRCCHCGRAVPDGQPLRLGHAAAGRPAVRDLEGLSLVRRSPDRAAAASSGDLGPPSGERRGAGARDRRARSDDRARPQLAATICAACRDGPWRSPKPRGCPRPMWKRSRWRRCSTTSASSPFRSTS